jgi:hypothetical protein
MFCVHPGVNMTRARVYGRELFYYYSKVSMKDPGMMRNL